MIWQQDFCADDTTLVGVVAVLAVIFAVQLFAGTIGGRCDGGLTCAAFDLVYMEMINCYGLVLLCFSVVNGGHAVYGIFYIIHVEDVFQ